MIIPAGDKTLRGRVSWWTQSQVRRCFILGIPTVVQWDWQHLWVLGCRFDPDPILWLRLQHCSGYNCGIGCNSGSDLIPSPGTPYAMAWPKKKKAKRKKEVVSFWGEQQRCQPGSQSSHSLLLQWHPPQVAPRITYWSPQLCLLLLLTFPESVRCCCQFQTFPSALLFCSPGPWLSLSPPPVTSPPQTSSSHSPPYLPSISLVLIFLFPLSQLLCVL